MKVEDLNRLAEDMCSTTIDLIKEVLVRHNAGILSAVINRLQENEVFKKQVCPANCLQSTALREKSRATVRLHDDPPYDLAWLVERKHQMHGWTEWAQITRCGDLVFLPDSFAALRLQRKEDAEGVIRFKKFFDEEGFWKYYPAEHQFGFGGADDFVAPSDPTDV